MWGLDSVSPCAYLQGTFCLAPQPTFFCNPLNGFNTVDRSLAIASLANRASAARE
jgi:hypothetical protein